MRTIPSVKFPGRIKGFSMTESEYKECENDYTGLCLACGEASEGGCEPDARGYTCESCDKPKVYGVPELLMMSRIVLEKDEE